MLPCWKIIRVVIAGRLHSVVIYFLFDFAVQDLAVLRLLCWLDMLVHGRVLICTALSQCCETLFKWPRWRDLARVQRSRVHFRWRGASIHIENVDTARYDGRVVTTCRLRRVNSANRLYITSMIAEIELWLLYHVCFHHALSLRFAYTIIIHRIFNK